MPIRSKFRPSQMLAYATRTWEISTKQSSTCSSRCGSSQTQRYTNFAALRSLAFGRLTSIQVFVALAELYEEAHRYSDAVATYQRSLKLNPGQTSIFYRITRILIRLHQEDTTKPHLSEAERWAAKYGPLFRPSLSTRPHCCIV